MVWELLFRLLIAPAHCFTQACAGLAETGVADEATWRALLGPDLTPLAPDALGGSSSAGAMAVGDPSVSAALEGAMRTSSIGGNSGSGSASSEAASEWGSLFEWPPAADGGNSNGSGVAANEGPITAQPAENHAPSAKPAPREWPVLRRDDGGDHVHHLHVRPAVSKENTQCQETYCQHAEWSNAASGLLNQQVLAEACLPADLMCL